MNSTLKERQSPLWKSHQTCIKTTYCKKKNPCVALQSLIAVYWKPPQKGYVRALFPLTKKHGESIVIPNIADKRKIKLRLINIIWSNIYLEQFLAEFVEF